METTVSVVIPAFNRAKSIARAIRSAREQGDVVTEIVVVDDASTDSTREIVLELGQEDPRVRLVCLDKNQGAQAARNAGIRASSSEWIAFLDSDDEFLPASVSGRLNAAISAGAEVVHSECLVVREGGEEPTTFGVKPLAGNVYRALLRGPGPVFPSLLVKRAALLHIGLLDTQIVAYQEWDTSIRLARFYRFAFVGSPTFLYDCRGGDTISKNMLRDAQGYEQIVKRHWWKTLSRCGGSAIANHCSQIAWRYQRAGYHDKAEPYRQMQRLFRMLSPRTFLGAARRALIRTIGTRK